MGLFTAEVERLLQAARLHLGKGELHESVGQATEVIRRDSKQPAAYLVRAEAHRRLNHPDRALADLAVAIRLVPQQPGPYVIRAEILKRRNLLDQAIADATHALSLDPRNAASFSIRAECRSAIGDVEGAGEDVQEMLLIDPTRPVPTLEAKRASSASEVELSNERFWKQAGKADPKQQLGIFADGKPVDQTYRSRPVVSNEDAPEALGVASGYKPESISQPIPRIRARREHASLSWLFIGIGIAGAGLIGFVVANRSPVAPEPVKALSTTQVSAPQPTTPQSANPIAPSQPDSPTSPEEISSVLSTPRTAQVPSTVVLRAGSDRLPPLPQGKTWVMVWHDEFDGTTLDAAKWTPSQEMKRKGGWWSPKAVSLDGQGHLVIKTHKDGGRYIDGCVSSQGKFEHAFGYYVARVRFQREPGHWSGFWMFSPGIFKVGDGGRDGSEIDIVTFAGRKD